MLNEASRCDSPHSVGAIPMARYRNYPLADPYFRLHQHL